MRARNSSVFARRASSESAWIAGSRALIALHARRELLEVALVLGAEDLGEDAVDHIWAVNN